MYVRHVAATQYLAEQPNTNRIIYMNSNLLSFIPLSQDTAFNRDDFIPFFSLQVIQFALYTAPSQTGIDSMETLEELAGEERIIFGSPGPGTPLHSIQSYMYTRMGADNDTVTYNNGSQGMVYLLGGDTMIMAASLSLAHQFVEDGSIVPLAVLSARDYDGIYGQIPSISQYGYELYNDMLTMYAIREGTDQQIVDLLYGAFERLMLNEAFKADMARAQTAEYRNLGPRDISVFLDQVDEQNEIVIQGLE